MVTGGFSAQDGMDTSRTSQGQKSDSRPTVERSGFNVAQADRQASGQCVYLQWQARASGEHQSMAQGIKAGRLENFAGMTSQTHLGKLAHSRRHTVARIAGVGRMVNTGDGAEVCAPIQ